MAKEPQKAAEATAAATAPAARPGRKKADPNETPRDRFKRVQTKTVRTALKAIQRVGNPVALRGFDYDDEDISKIMQSLRAFCDAAEQALNVGKNKAAIKDDGPQFQL